MRRTMRWLRAMSRVMQELGFIPVEQAQPGRGSSCTPAAPAYSAPGSQHHKEDSNGRGISISRHSSDGTQDASGARRSSPFLERKLMLGLTATPFRADKKDLRSVFQKRVYEVTLQQLISAGYLCKIRGQRVLTQQDISAAASGDSDASNGGDGDFSTEVLSRAVNSPGRNALVVDAYLEYGRGRPTIAFCCDVTHARDLAAAFIARGVPAAALTGEIRRRPRDELLQKHQSGELEVLTSVGILTEVYDFPPLSCILMARPTRSRGLYMQCIGRGLRKHAGKDDCLVIDFTDPLHTLDAAPDVVDMTGLGLQPGDSLVGYYETLAERRQTEIQQILEGGHLQLYREQQYAWVPHRHDFWLRLYKDPWGYYWVHLKRLERAGGINSLYEMRVAVGSSRVPPLRHDNWDVLQLTPQYTLSQVVADAEKALCGWDWPAARARGLVSPELRRTPELQHIILHNMTLGTRISCPTRVNDAKPEEAQELQGLGVTHPALTNTQLTQGIARDLFVMACVDKASWGGSTSDSKPPDAGSAGPDAGRLKRLLHTKLARMKRGTDSHSMLAVAGLTALLAPDALKCIASVEAAYAVEVLRDLGA